MEDLVYVSDSDPGILRVSKGDHFVYLVNGREIRDTQELKRIASLAIPPAWQQVWICSNPNGHIQSTGYDARHRKQYRYHTHWQESRNESKFHKLLEFGKVLPKLRIQLKRDIARRKLTEEKVIATVLMLMEQTYIRIGNNQYEKSNHSYGLTTLKNRHVRIVGSKLQFSFVGKKGITHRIALRNRQLAHIVKECHDIPGKELFQYLDVNGDHRPIDSGQVNRYIKAATNSDFTAKDLRTWAGTINALQALSAVGDAETASEKKHKLFEALDQVSRKLGNTRTVCRKYYVHPLVMELYETGELKQYIRMLDKPHKEVKTGLTAEEKVLMKLLRHKAKKKKPVR